MRPGQMPASNGELCRIFPAWAAWVLETFIPQAIPEDMRALLWKPSHEGIAFSLPPVILIDGQNRLAAIVEANMPVAMLGRRDRTVPL
jgi:hypothetical protein